MAEEELDFEEDEMQADEGSVLSVTQLGQRAAFWGCSWGRRKTQYCKQDASSLFGKVSSTWAPSRSTADRPRSVGRRGGDSSVSRGAWADGAGWIFANESSRDLFEAKQPEDDSYKGRAQRHLDERVMRMMRARRTTFSGNNMSAGLDENLNLNLRWRLRFQASIVRWKQMLQMRWEAQGWRGVQVCGLGFLWKALSRHPRQSSCFHEIHTGSQHPTSTIQVYIFWGKLCSNLLWSIIRWKANTWRSFLQQSSGWCMWRSLTEDIEPWDEWRTITKGQGRHRIQEGSTSRGCKIGRQRVEAL